MQMIILTIIIVGFILTASPRIFDLSIGKKAINKNKKKNTKDL